MATGRTALSAFSPLATIGYRPRHPAAPFPGAQKPPGCCGGQDPRPPTLESSAQKVGTARGVPKSPRRRGGGGGYVSSSTSGRWKADPKGPLLRHQRKQNDNTTGRGSPGQGAGHGRRAPPHLPEGGQGRRPRQHIQAGELPSRAHVLDVSAGRQPNIHSDGALYRLLAHCPRPAWRWEHLEDLQDAHADDGEGERPAGRRIVTGPQRKHYHIETSLDGLRWTQDATADPSKTTARRARPRGPGRALPAIRVAPCFDGGCGWFTGTAPPTA